MPEGPEIRRSADQLAAALLGRRARQIYFAHEHLKAYESTLARRRVTGVTSRGKAMLIRFEGGWTVYSHNQLYGRWYVKPAGRTPNTRRQLRLAIHNSKQSALLYSASDIDVLDRQGIKEHPFLSRLGPDLLDRRVTASRIARRYVEPAFRRRSLAALLLDQGFVAGTGNYLRSEILFRAGLGPDHRPADLDEEAIAALAASTVATTRRSYRTGGITNDPGHVARLKRSGARYGEYRHFVFGREGKACHQCGDTIVRADYAGRRLYWCPACQV